MAGEVGEQRVEQVIGIAVFVEPDRDRAAVALEELRRRVVLLEVNDHILAPDCARGQRPLRIGIALWLSCCGMIFSVKTLSRLATIFYAGCSRAANMASHR